MADLQTPPTWALPILVDERTKVAQFNPVWLKWFIDLTGILNAFGGTALFHNLLSGLQGGATDDYYHFTAAQRTDLTDAGDSALHYHATDRARANHTGTQGIATLSDLPALASGVYTPTLSNVANLDASTTYEAQYLRVGATVLVSGRVDADPAAAVATQLGISLPIASNLGAPEDCAGTAFASAIAGQGAAILGDAANNRAEMNWIAVDLTNQPMYFNFAYQVI